MKVGQIYFDRHEVQKKLGEGAYGIVWLAEDQLLHRCVAIKELTDSMRNGWSKRPAPLRKPGTPISSRCMTS